MAALDANLMRAIAPSFSGGRGVAQSAIIHGVGAALAATLERYEIASDLRAAHFLAQTCHESDSFCTTVEYASGEAYEGRKDLGNTQPGDGPRYKGRGLIQLTGRANYTSYGAALGLDLVGQPEIAADPPTSLVIACEFWKQRGLNALADQDDIEGITRRINGGLNGLSDRQIRLARAKAALGLSGTGAPAVARGVVRTGSRGADVSALQTALVAKGHPMAVDGVFGPGTEAAVRQFQRDQRLSADGVVGPATWAALGLA
jgi:putative chitinase